jgi:hypothetical protein
LSWDEIKYNYDRIKTTKFNTLTSSIQSSLDPDVYSYTRYAGITDSVTISALNTFVIGLKQQRLWDKITDIYPFINSLSSSLFNLKDAGLPRLRTNNSWSFNTSSGVIPVSTNSSLIVPRQAAVLSHANEYPFYASQSSHLTYLTYDQYQSDGVLLGTQNYTDTNIQATGGNVYFTRSRTVHQFTESGDFTVTTEGYVDVLITAGGGSGGTAGGSGGGGANDFAGQLTLGQAGAGTAGQGRAGFVAATGVQIGAGGGGAGQGGTAGAGGPISYNGGNGTSTSISGTLIYYAGGGGGGGGDNENPGQRGLGGLGGGGNGGQSGLDPAYAGSPGTANTGGGGGGSGGTLGTPTAGGSGGSGIVILSYESPTQTATGGTVTSYSSGGDTYWVHTFTTSGTFTA